MRNRIFTLACLSVFSLVAACGGDDTNGGGSTTDAGSHGDASVTGDAATSDAGGNTDGALGDAAANDGAANDSGSASDAGAKDAASDAGFVVVNGCNAADYTNDVDAAIPTITFPTSPAPSQYAPNCVKIKAGQQVLWAGSFSNHPLEPAGANSSPNNPIMVTSSGVSKAFTFPTPGTYGFDCQAHPAQMMGAVLVEP